MMCSSLKKTGYNIRNEVVKQKKLSAVCFTLTVICIIWNIWNAGDIWAFYRQPISVADLLIDLQQSNRFGIIMFPILLFYILKCKQDSLNLQIALRYGSRSRMFRSLLLESGIYAVTISAIMVLLESIVGCCFLRDWINWNDASSKFYMTTGVLSNMYFLEIVVTVWVMYILKFLLILFLMDMLLWYQKYMILIWVLVMLVYVLDLPTLGPPIFHKLYSVQYSYALSRTELILPLLIGIFLLLTEYLIGTMFIQKKDIFQ